MPKRKSKLLVELGFQVLPAQNGVPETYKCLCEEMTHFVEYRAALDHSKICERCQVKLARLSSTKQYLSSGKSVLAFLHVRSHVHRNLTRKEHDATFLQKRCLKVALDPLNKLRVVHMVPTSHLTPLGNIQQPQCMTNCSVREKISQCRNWRRRLPLCSS
jgi:hypothetical protein